MNVAATAATCAATVRAVSGAVTAGGAAPGARVATDGAGRPPAARPGETGHARGAPRVVVRVGPLLTPAKGA
jgi:hypothetical protein